MKHTNNTKANFPPLSPEKCCTEFKENIFLCQNLLYFTKQCEISLPQNTYFTAAMQCGRTESTRVRLFNRNTKVNLNCTNI